jgi:3-oxoacyl-[acyl-carrier protein] reductase
MNKLRGRVAFVTGGSSGIGLAAVRVFAQAGLRVAFTYRRAEQRRWGPSTLCSTTPA